MNRPIVVVGAPSSIGIKPYDDGRARRLDLAPGALREQGLVERLGARDVGDVIPPPYRDFTRPPDGVRNEEGVSAYSRALADRVAEAGGDGAFVLVVGGDCSILLGSLLGVRRAGPVRPGLAYLDAHADFATPERSRSGSAASMCLALAAGRGGSPLARLGGRAPLVRERDLVVLGRRDDAYEPIYGQDVLRSSAILDLPCNTMRDLGGEAVSRMALDRLARAELGGFWIHVDADVLDPIVMPAVDSPEPEGLTSDELVALLRPLAWHPQALGLQLTIYDPALDGDRVGARTLVDLLERALTSDARLERPASP